MVEVKHVSRHHPIRCEDCGEANLNYIWVADAVIDGRGCRVVFFKDTSHFQYWNTERKNWDTKSINELWGFNFWRVEIHYYDGEVEWRELPQYGVNRWDSKDPTTHDREYNADVVDMLQWC